MFSQLQLMSSYLHNFSGDAWAVLFLDKTMLSTASCKIVVELAM